METFRTNLESLVRNTSTLNSAAGPSRVKKHTGTGYLHFRLNNVSNDCYKAEEVPRTPSQARLVAAAIKTLQ